MKGWGEQWASLPPYLGAHIELTLISLAIGFALSIPLGILASRHPRLERVALGIASVLQTIPGLALLALMVALLGAISAWLEARGGGGISSIGFLPAVAALSLYSVLPMLRNTVTGLSEVDPALREAALGVGMSDRERLWQVELPLAMPTIVAGIRTASVWVVGTATLATPVGAASLGNPIFAGLQTRNLTAVVVGSIAAAGLAIVLDGLIRILEVGFARRSGARIVAGLIGVAALAILGWSWSGTQTVYGRDDSPKIVIGSKSFTEQYILAEWIEQEIAEVSGAHVEVRTSLGSAIAFDALSAGDLDVYVDYTGTIWATIFQQDTANTDRQKVLGAVRKRLPKEHAVHVLAALGFENTYAIAMRADQAQRLGIRRVSDLIAHAGRFSIASDYEFFQRAEWQSLVSTYGLKFGSERGMDASLMYEAIRREDVDVIGAYSTDGRIAAYDLVVLEDDRAVIPPYDAMILASDRMLEKAPEVAARLRGLEGRIGAAQMRAMNAAVDLDGQDPSEVAQAWRIRALRP